MFIKVGPEKQATFKSTWTSRFVHLLIKIFFFPVTIEEDNICFRWLSWRILLHITLGVGLFVFFTYLGMSSINFLDLLKANFSDVRDI